MHAPGQHAVEVRHQLDVVAVVAADVLETVGEGLAGREVLLEAGEAAAERMAPRIDDPRVRQDQLNEAGVREVVRQLVDEERRRALALDPRAAQVLLAEGAALSGIERGEQVDVATRLLRHRARAELARDGHEIRQLHRALDGRVAGEDLLKQRRAGSRQADDEDRVRCRAAEAAARREEIRAQYAPRVRQARRVVVGVVADVLAAQPVTFGVMRERVLVLSRVLERLGEREMEMEAVVRRKLRALERAAHRGHFGGREAKRLEISETPVALAELRCELDAAAVGGNSVALAPGSLERVAVAHPDTRLGRVLGQDALVQLDGLCVFPDRIEDRRLEVTKAGVARLAAEDPLDLGQRLDLLVLAVQHERVVVARGREAGRELEAASQQLLGVRVAAQAARHLRKHADRGDVSRVGLEVRAQQHLGLRYLVGAQRRRRLEQARVAGRGTDVLRVGSVGAHGIADDRQVVGELAPGVGQVRIEHGRATQGMNCGLALASRCASTAEFVVERRPVRLARRQRLQECERRLRVAEGAAREAEHQRRGRVPGDRLQDLARLLHRERRLRVQQTGGVGECDLERSDRFRRCTQRAILARDRAAMQPIRPQRPTIVNCAPPGACPGWTAGAGRVGGPIPPARPCAARTSART